MIFREKIELIIEQLGSMSGAEITYFREMGEGNSVFKFRKDKKEKSIKIREDIFNNFDFPLILSLVKIRFGSLERQDTVFLTPKDMNDLIKRMNQ